jgi:hypothetical protein
MTRLNHAMRTIPSLKALFTAAVLAVIMACAGSTAAAGVTQDSLKAWKHSGTFYILTTPEGADLPATARESNFPLLLRLNRDTR